MKNKVLGDRLKTLREMKNMSQKEFAVFIDVPQPSLSAYENNRNSPTIDVLINIAEKCHISLDWLCGMSSSKHTLSSLSDIVEFLYALMETEGIHLDIKIHCCFQMNKCFADITVCGNDFRYEHNEDLYNIIRKVKGDIQDLESYTISKEMYDIAKRETIEFYSFPLKRKELLMITYEK